MRIPIFSWLIHIAIFSRFFCEHGTLAASVECPSDQQQPLLLSLKNELVFNASLSTKLVTWNPSSSSWAGVACEGDRVTALDLSNETISSGINASSSLFSLRSLQSLNLAFNRFNSTEIPPQIANLSSLEYLNLSNANFTGQIPIEISSLTRLTTLDLSLLYFPGIPSLKLENPNLRGLVAGLRELRGLYLDGVNISAAGDEWCGALASSLPKLRELSMSNCFLSGPINPSLVNLTSLSVIRLGNNNFSEIPGFFANFSNLTSLGLSSNGLSGMFPARIFQVRTLQNLVLSNNPMLQGSLPEFRAVSSLSAVDVSYTNFSGPLPASIDYLGNLSRLVLLNCRFSGPIPMSMGNLSKLVYLDLSFNNFSGPLPSFTSSRNLTQIILSHNALTGNIESTKWKFLQNLEILDLRYNSIVGSIPASLFSLPLVQEIQLSNNQFSGQVQLDESASFSSSQLEIVDLSSNDLFGPVPTALFQFPGLKYLSLSFNNFNGSLGIDMVQNVSNLSYLDLSYNDFSIDSTGPASAISSFPQMSTVKLGSCRLKVFPRFLSNQSKLLNLDLSNNEIGGAIPKWISNLTNLQYLNLSVNYLEDRDMVLHNFPEHLAILDLHSNNFQGQLPTLRFSPAYLDYSKNNFSSAIPDNIGDNLTFAYFFSLSENNFHGDIPASLCQGTYLQVLDLSNNHLSGSIPGCLVKEALKVLNLRRNSLNGSIPQSFNRSCGLRTLDLSWNQLEGQVPKCLSNCSMLEVLNLGHNQITDGFPCQLKNSTNLRVLVLRSNNFSGMIGCPSNCNSSWDLLQIFDLANNKFSKLPPKECLSSWRAMQNRDGFDHLQQSFLELSGFYYQDTVTVTVKGLTVELVKILTLFTSIDISANQITGRIPDALGTFKALRLLNGSHNQFSGTIPPSLGNLQDLEALDISMNFLTGFIPQELANLSFLELLNLSNNLLTGAIPSSAQFDTFTASSYEGNPGLCGRPLDKKCSALAPTPTPSNRAPLDEGAGFDWQYILIGLGYGTGAAVAVAPLTLWTTGRRWYDHQIDKFLLVFLPILGFSYTIWDDEESRDGDDDDDDDGDDIASASQGEESWGRYCVFCSKLDHTMKKVIHNPNCTCHDSPYNSSSFSSYSSSTSS